MEVGSEVIFCFGIFFVVGEGSIDDGWDGMFFSGVGKVVVGSFGDGGGGVVYEVNIFFVYVFGGIGDGLLNGVLFNFDGWYGWCG